MAFVSTLVWLLAAVLALALSGAARSAYLRASTATAVDHYYWILAARAYRGIRGLPVRIHGKYLLEDARQAYPPGYGMLLAAFPESFVASRRSVLLVVAVDGLTLVLVLAVGAALGIGPFGLLTILLVYGLAPVLVAYNTQLTSRGLGNFFLVVSLFAQVAAAASTGIAALGLALLGACALSAVFCTHKMTTQFFVFLLPSWLFSLAPLGPMAPWIVVLTPLASMIFAILATGLHFQALQWRAHWDIVTFWSRNWRFLGAHQFRQSPIYGDAQTRAPGAFHGVGISGACRHAALLLAYLPIALPLPVTLFFAPSPPTFIIAWSASAVFAALATLYIRPLKCLGGGHLYMFNAVPPVALWWGYLFSESGSSFSVIALFVSGLIATGLSLLFGLARRSKQKSEDDSDASALLKWLKCQQVTRVAAFPVTFAERIALETDHAVFWGGHGLGFRTLEPYWPVMRKKLNSTFLSWGITVVVLDLSWWPEGEEVIAAEVGANMLQRFGRFALFRLA